MPIQGPPNTEGTMTITVLDTFGAANNVLDGTQSWQVKFDWSVTQGAGLLIPPMQWRLRVYIEAMGTGFEGMVASADVPVALPNPATGYTNTITVPATAASTPTTPNPSGVYRVVGVLTLYTATATGLTPLPVAGYAEGPIIQFMLP